MRLAFTAPFVLALAACAAPEPTQVAAADSAGTPARRVECHQESDIGSNMIHKVCTQQMTDAERARLNAELANKMHEMTVGGLVKPANQ